MILEYMLIREMGVKRAPSWVEDGGYFGDPDNSTLIGWSPDLANRDYYVPDSVVELNRASLTARVLDINTRYPAMGPGESGDMVPVTDEELTATVDAWCDAHGEP
jgi:hypothetical protein